MIEKSNLNKRSSSVSRRSAIVPFSVAALRYPLSQFCTWSRRESKTEGPGSRSDRLWCPLALRASSSRFHSFPAGTPLFPALRAGSSKGFAFPVVARSAKKGKGPLSIPSTPCSPFPVPPSSARGPEGKAKPSFHSVPNQRLGKSGVREALGKGVRGAKKKEGFAFPDPNLLSTQFPTKGWERVEPGKGPRADLGIGDPREPELSGKKVLIRDAKNVGVLSPGPFPTFGWDLGKGNWTKQGKGKLDIARERGPSIAKKQKGLKEVLQARINKKKRTQQGQKGTAIKTYIRPIILPKSPALIRFLGNINVFNESFLKYKKSLYVHDSPISATKKKCGLYSYIKGSTATQSRDFKSYTFLNTSVTLQGRRGKKCTGQVIYSARFIDYKNSRGLQQYIGLGGRILPRRQTCLSSKQQRYIAKTIKSARITGLLPFVAKY
uniref:Small ribosomal subunit protein bS18c n=1 Tax=Volvocales sp. NrCl902 TaxID=2682054 RepID=A0A7G1GG99_9CHLO|nr:ribosomal protein S18 [Volvocales sp. NrCl902]